MNPKILTIEHEYCVRGTCAVLAAAGHVPVADALDTATDHLEAVVAGLRELMSTPSCSNQATLIFFAAQSALALVYGAHAGIDAAAGGAA